MLSLQYRSKYISKNWIERNTIINHHYKAEQLHYIAFHVSAPWSWEHGAWKFHNQDKLKYIFERQLLWGYLKGYFTFELMKKTSFKIDNRTSFIVSHSQKCRLWATWKQCSEPVGSQKQVQQVTRISSEGCVHWPVPVPNRRGLLHLLQRRSWRPLSALVLHAALLGEKTHHSQGKQPHCKVTAWPQRTQAACSPSSWWPPALCRSHVHTGILSKLRFGGSQILTFRAVAEDVVHSHLWKHKVQHPLVFLWHGCNIQFLLSVIQSF